MANFISVLLVLCILTIVLGCQQGQTAPAQSISLSPLSPPSSRNLQDSIIVNDNQALIPDLLLRALARHYGFLQATATKLQVIPGDLPEAWELELPLLERTRVIGTILAEGGNGPQTQVFLDVAEAMEAVEDAYRTSLATQGLREIVPFGISVPAPSPHWRSLSFCARNVDVRVLIQRMEETLTHVSLSLETFSASPCITADFSHRAPLPAQLTAPPGRHWGISSSGNDELGSVHQYLTIETPLSLQEIIEHYANQLEANGWEQVEAGHTENTAWSVWKFLDQRNRPWSSIILVFDNPLRPDRKSITIRAYRQED
jgi:hypothetical protein